MDRVLRTVPQSAAYSGRANVRSGAFGRRHAEVLAMSGWEPALEERLTAGDLITELTRLAPKVGANECAWPGMTTYRFISPQSAHWDEVQSLALCCVVQGRKRVVVDGVDYLYDPFHYLVFTRGMRFQAEILEAGPQLPFLSFVLQIDPGIVRQVSTDMADRTTTTFHRPTTPSTVPAYVSAVQQNLMGAVLRFLRSVSAGADRRVLAPGYLREISYRLLQAEQCSRLLAAAMTEHENDPVTAVIRYLRERMSEPVTVAELAEHVFMSPSAFAHLFRDVTGMAPYQFVKTMRLDRARVLILEDGLGVGEASQQVGYTSLSHFINEFKRHFGVTPGTLAAQRNGMRFRVDRATSAHESTR
jgi:AraC-like DNA-binding protein